MVPRALSVRVAAHGKWLREAPRGLFGSPQVHHPRGFLRRIAPHSHYEHKQLCDGYALITATTQATGLRAVTDNLLRNTQVLISVNIESRTALRNVLLGSVTSRPSSQRSIPVLVVH